MRRMQGLFDLFLLIQGPSRSRFFWLGLPLILLLVTAPQGLWAEPEETPLTPSALPTTPEQPAPAERPLLAGQKLLESNCSACHPAPAPQDHLPSEWPSILQRMGPMAFLSETDTQEILAYIQAVQTGNMGLFPSTSSPQAESEPQIPLSPTAPSPTPNGP